MSSPLSSYVGQNPEIAHFDETTVKFVVVQTFW